MWEEGSMRFLMRSPIFLILFTIFSLLSFGLTAIAQEISSYGCENKDKKTHVDCLRSLLDSTQYGENHPGRGSTHYACYGGDDDEKLRKEVTCLKLKLDKYGPHLAKGASEPIMPLGTMPPPCPPGTNCDPTPNSGKMPLNVEHPCYNVPPAERNGHSCWNNTTQENQEGLNARITQLENDLKTAYEGQYALNDRIAQLEAELSASNSAQEPLSSTRHNSPSLENSSSPQVELNARIGELGKELSTARQLNSCTAKIKGSARSAGKRLWSDRIALKKHLLHMYDWVFNTRGHSGPNTFENTRDLIRIVDNEMRELTNKLDAPICNTSEAKKRSRIPCRNEEEGIWENTGIQLETIINNLDDKFEDIKSEVREAWGELPKIPILIDHKNTLNQMREDIAILKEARNC